MISLFAAILIALSGSAEPMMVDGHMREVVKIVLVARDGHGATTKLLPEDSARLGHPYGPANPADVAVVRRAAADLMGSAPEAGTLRGQGFETINWSKGTYAAGQINGWMNYGSMPLASVQERLVQCSAGAPESIGGSAPRAYYLVRVNCPDRTDELRHAHVAFTVESDRIVALLFNVGDLPNMVYDEAPVPTQGAH